MNQQTTCLIGDGNEGEKKMKRMKMKALLSFASVATLAMGVSLAVSNPVTVETASAATTHTEEVFLMSGASIRYSNPTGIRFTGYVKDDGDLSDNVVGMKISVDGVEKDFSTATIDGETWQWATSDVEGYRKFHIVIKDIPETQYATEMTAQAYMDDYKSAEIVTRSVARVANAALAADTLEGKLSQYKIEALESYINDAAIALPFETADIAISGASLTWNAVENAQGYLVQLGNEVKNIPANGGTVYSVNLADFNAEKGTVVMLPYGDGTAYTYASAPYTVEYDNSKYMVSFDTEGGSKIETVQVDKGTTIAEFYKQKYIPADSGFVFDYWLYNGEKVDETDVVTSDMTLVARYKRVDGYAVEESPVNGDFYQAFLAIPTDEEVGTSVLITMDIFLTGKIVSSGVDTTDEYYNEWTTSNIAWVDSVWTTSGGELKDTKEVLSFDTLRANKGGWITVSFAATVRNFPVLKTGTGWADVDMGDQNAVYLYASHFKSAASFNYRNVEVSTDGIMPAGTQKNTPDKYYQSAVGLSTDLPAGTFVKVDMDVQVTGTIDSYSYISWIDTIWGDYAVNNETKVADYTAINNNDGRWMHLEFYAMVRDFDLLCRDSSYPTIDVSETGTGVFIMASNFTSANTFVYKNVIISADENDVGKAMPAGTQKTSNANGYYQAAAGLSTDLPVGSSVLVEMDVLVTGAYDQYSTGLRWVDTVWTTAGGEVNAATTIVNVETMNNNAGKWFHVSFYATVRDFSVLRLNSAYATVDVSSYGNAVFLVADAFKSAASLNYKNVSIVSAMPNGVQKTSGNAKQYRQAFVGLPVDAPVGTPVTVEMDIYVTGTYDQYTQGIKWVDTVWTTAGGELNGATTIVDYATMSANVGKWIHVTFEATVRDFDVLRLNNSEYTTIDTSAYGTAVYLVAYSFTSAESFIYKNVTMKPILSVPNGISKSNGFYQAFVGLSTNYAVGTAVAVEMDIYVTGTVDSATNLGWVDTVWTTAGGEVNANPQILSSEELNANAGKWIHVEFEATVRNFSVLRMDSSFTTMDVSAYGNAVYIMAKNFKSAASFNYKNVTIKLPGEGNVEIPEEPEIGGVEVPAGTCKTGTTSGYRQAFVGLSTDLEADTYVNVSMDIYVTGTFDQYSSIRCLHTVYSLAGGEVNLAPVILGNAAMNANKGQWVRVTFDAIVRDYSVLRLNSAYSTMDVSAYGNAVFLVAENFTSAESFHYKNVTIVPYDTITVADGVSKSNGFYQAFTGISLNLPAGTSVTVGMDIYVTGTVDSATNLGWVDTVWTTAGGEVNANPQILSSEELNANAGKWIHVEFEATVRNFNVLRMDSSFSTMDVSAYGNAVYIMAKNFKSASSFVYKDVVVTIDGVEVGPEKEYKPEIYTTNWQDITDYAIVVADNADKATQYAATILQARLRDAIGVDLAVITDATEQQPLEIILGNTNRSACSVIDFSLLGSESFFVHNVGYDLVIAGNERGVLYGVYAYLEALGYRFYTVDVETIPAAEDVFVPASIELTWTPTFEYRETMYEMTWDAEWAVSQRVNSDFVRGDLKADSRYGGFTGYVGGNNWTVHTLHRLLPVEEFETNPTYFAERNGERKAQDSDGHCNQPCLSSEGAYQLILNNALAMIASDRKANIISISENDGGEYCTCSACQASYDQYGLSGTFFRFINRIAGDIAKVYPDVYVDTLSYDMSKEVPTGIMLADNVIVRVCLRMCNFCTDPSTCENLAADQQRLKDFVAISDNVYVWCYPINWGNLFASLPNYEEMRNNIKYFAVEGVKGVYAEGYSKENPEFGELKAYLMAKLLQNPTMSKAEYEYHLNDFLQGYYGEAAEYIAQYISLTEEMLDKKLASGHLDYYYTVDQNFVFTWNSSTNTYDMTYINQINALWNQALNSVENGSTQWHNVKKSMIHWTYIELCNTMDKRYQYGSEEEKAELVARNEALYNDLKYYGITRIFDNSHDLINVTDFTKSPNKDKGDWFNEKWTIGDLI